MSSIMGKDQGVYNPAQRYKIKNILEHDFTTKWNNNAVTIKAGATVTVPEYLADKIVDEIVNEIMIAEVKAKETAYYEKNPNAEVNRFRAPSNLGVPAARKVWEDQIIVEKVQLEEGSTEAQLLKLQVQEELEKDLKAEISTEPVQVPVSAVGQFSESSLEEFAEIKPQRPKKK